MTVVSTVVIQMNESNHPTGCRCKSCKMLYDNINTTGIPLKCQLCSGKIENDEPCIWFVDKPYHYECFSKLYGERLVAG